MKLSIVATLYKSAPYIKQFYDRASAAAHQLVADDYEIILVNDGSPDNSLDLAVQLTQVDPHVFVVDLSRNFGHHKAIMAGLSYAVGDLVFLIDSDLEEKPEWLLSFAEVMQSTSCDVVYGVQEKRKGGVFERVSGVVFYKILNSLSNCQVPKNLVIARLMTREYVQALLLYKESEIYLGGLMFLAGYNQVPSKVQKGHKGQSTYSLKMKISTSFNSITSVSSKPLMYVFNIGIIVSSISTLLIIKIMIDYFLQEKFPGWTSITVTILFVGGILMSSIGIVGLYVAKVFNEVKNRPNTITRRVYSRDMQEINEN